MVKHIIGLIICALIVGTTVAVSRLLIIPFNGLLEHSCAIQIRQDQLYKKKKFRESRKKRPQRKSIDTSITQAVFDKNKGILTTNVISSNDSIATKVDLHFFVKGEFQTHYLKKESITVSNSQSVYEFSFAWLTRFESWENMYVMSVPIDSIYDTNHLPSFNSSMAIPILLKSAN